MSLSVVKIFGPIDHLPASQALRPLANLHVEWDGHLQYQALGDSPLF